MAGEKLLSSLGSPVCCSVMTWRNGMGAGEGDAEGRQRSRLIRTVVQQKPTQHCKKNFFNLKKKEMKSMNSAARVPGFTTY